MGRGHRGPATSVAADQERRSDRARAPWVHGRCQLVRLGLDGRGALRAFGIPGSRDDALLPAREGEGAFESRAWGGRSALIDAVVLAGERGLEATGAGDDLWPEAGVVSALIPGGDIGSWADGPKLAEGHDHSEGEDHSPDGATDDFCPSRDRVDMQIYAVGSRLLQQPDEVGLVVRAGEVLGNQWRGDE